MEILHVRNKGDGMKNEFEIWELMRATKYTEIQVRRILKKTNPDYCSDAYEFVFNNHEKVTREMVTNAIEYCNDIRTSMFLKDLLDE